MSESCQPLDDSQENGEGPEIRRNAGPVNCSEAARKTWQHYTRRDGAQDVPGDVDCD
jgi:hypothetical protein